MRVNMRRYLVSGTVLVELALGGGVGAAYAAPEKDAGTLSEIVVTAQKRGERLEDVPATITAVTPQQIAALGINSTLQLGESTPGVTIGQTAAWTNFYMRGIGNDFNTPAAQSPVALYVDGVYHADAAAMAFGLNDVALERIEVLKGPQGILYGRNALGGAINVITKAPSKDLQLDVRATGGNLGDGELAAYMSGGNDVLQASLAVDRHVRDGYNKNIAPGGRDQDNIDDLSILSKLRYAPSQNIEITLGLDYSLQKGRGPGTQDLPFPAQPTAFAGGVVPTGALFGGILTTEPWRTSVASDLSVRARDEGVSLIGRFHFDAFDLVSITAYRNYSDRLGVDFDATNATVTEWRAELFHRQTSQEFQIISPASGRLSWIAGLYYLHDNAGDPNFHFNQFANFGGVYVDLHTAVRNDSYAGFLTGTYKITDALSIVAGADHYLAQETVTLAAPPIVVAAIDSGGSSQSWSAFTPQITLKYERPEGIYYLTASKGYSAGLYNITNIAPIAALDQPVAPQKMKALEVGAKWKLFDDRLRLNVSGFYYNLEDLQVQQLASSGFTTFENSDAKIRGIDADLLWAATSNLTVRAAIESLTAYYSAYHNAAVWSPNLQQGNFAVPPCGGQPGTTPFDAECLTSADLTGQTLLRSPKITSTLGFDWRIPIVNAGQGSVVLSANWYHSASYLESVNASIVSPAYDSYSANLGYMSPDKTWSASLWGHNLSNAKYFLTGGDANYGRTIMYAEPRTYGVSIGFHFGH
jgi:iron complex outermembrane recepter protein